MPTQPTPRPASNRGAAVGALATAAVLAGAGSGGVACLGLGVPLYEGFGDPERVSLQGYDGIAMEPFVSKDGRWLFYNTSNAPDVDTQLRYAERVDDLTYLDRGELSGANSSALDGVASLDRDGGFYFVSTCAYDDSLQTLFRGRFASGAIEHVEVVEGLSRRSPGAVNFDAEISEDGELLYYVDGRFGLGPMPEQADILVARRDGEGPRFTPLADAEALLAAVNTGDLEYAPCISSDGLELFFTRSAWLQTQVYRARRARVDAPFGEVERVASIPDGTEAPTLSADGRALIYHQAEDGGFALYRVTR